MKFSRVCVSCAVYLIFVFNDQAEFKQALEMYKPNTVESVKLNRFSAYKAR